MLSTEGATSCESAKAFIRALALKHRSQSRQIMTENSSKFERKFIALADIRKKYVCEIECVSAFLIRWSHDFGKSRNIVARDSKKVGSICVSPQYRLREVRYS